MEYTEIEKKFLTMLFQIGELIISTDDGYYEINYETFDRNDLFNLAEKLGVDY